MHTVVWTVSDNDEWSEIWFVFFEKNRDGNVKLRFEFK